MSLVSKETNYHIVTHALTTCFSKTNSYIWMIGLLYEKVKGIILIVMYIDFVLQNNLYDIGSMLVAISDIYTLKPFNNILIFENLSEQLMWLCCQSKCTLTKTRARCTCTRAVQKVLQIDIQKIHKALEFDLI